jgi:hypothetical protein
VLEEERGKETTAAAASSAEHPLLRQQLADKLSVLLAFRLWLCHSHGMIARCDLHFSLCYLRLIDCLEIQHLGEIRRLVFTRLAASEIAGQLFLLVTRGGVTLLAGHTHQPDESDCGGLQHCCH